MNLNNIEFNIHEQRYCYVKTTKMINDMEHHVLNNFHIHEIAFDMNSLIWNFRIINAGIIDEINI